MDFTYWSWDWDDLMFVLLLIGCVTLGLKLNSIIRWYHVRRRPKVYTCRVNGITGVILAKDYDAVARAFWRDVRKGKQENPGSRGPRLAVKPVFLFSDITLKGRSRLVGKMFQLEQFLVGCRMEDRTFYLPPADSESSAWKGAKGTNADNGLGHFDRLDRLYSFEEAYWYIHSLKFPRPGLEISADGHPCLQERPIPSARHWYKYVC